MDTTMQRPPEARTLDLPPAGPLQLLPFPWSEDVKHLLARCERQILGHAIHHARGVKSRAADLLGISPFALQRRLHRVARLLDASTLEEAPSTDPSRPGIAEGS